MLIGNLGSDPVKRYTQSGAAVVNFNIATNERWTGKDGNRQERTEWHKVVVFGNQAENCEKYLSKGRSVFVEGRLQTRDWEDKDGNKRYTTEIVANNVVFLSGQGAGGGSGRDDYGDPGPSASPEANFDQSFNDDDIPF
jgi:single-strand DNA-binding protein